jgi:hypothetical protein
MLLMREVLSVSPSVVSAENLRSKEGKKESLMK